MGETRYVRITAILFAIVAALHFSRIVFGWSATIAGWSVPGWISWVGMVLAAGLSAYGVALLRRRK